MSFLALVGALALAAEPAGLDHVVLTAPPVAQATVLVDGLEVGVTNAEGRIVLQDVAAGDHEIRVVKDGWQYAVVVETFDRELNPPKTIPTTAPPPAETGADGDPPPGRDEGVGMGWVYLLLVGAIVALAGGLTLAVRRRGVAPSAPASHDSMPTLASNVEPLDPRVHGPPPSLGDRYRVVGLIKQGGFGEIYLARGTETAAFFAVKVPRANMFSDDTVLRAFLEEAERSKRLLNSHIITVFEAGVDTLSNRPFYIMEYFDGITLREYLRRFGSMPADAAIATVVLRVLDALNYAHAKAPPFVHGDLKPENIMVRYEPSGAVVELKLIDFGLAFEERPGLAGTPPYVAPEVLEGEVAGPGADLFSLGVILVELLTGRPPFYAEQIHQMKRNILEQEHDPDLLPPVLQPLVARLLDKKLTNRYASAEEAILDCRQAQLSLSHMSGIQP